MDSVIPKYVNESYLQSLYCTIDCTEKQYLQTLKKGNSIFIYITLSQDTVSGQCVFLWHGTCRAPILPTPTNT